MKKKLKVDLTTFDDDAIRILYQWAQNAIICDTALVTERITAIINEYNRRGFNTKEQANEHD